VFGDVLNGMTTTCVSDGRRVRCMKLASVRYGGSDDTTSTTTTQQYNIIIAINLSTRYVGNIAPSANVTVQDAFNALDRTVQQYDRQYYYYVGVLLGERASVLP
jgi:hypothetical protein